MQRKKNNMKKENYFKECIDHMMIYQNSVIIMGVAYYNWQNEVTQLWLHEFCLIWKWSACEIAPDWYYVT